MEIDYSKYSKRYREVRTKLENWPNYKKEIYNNNVSKHAILLPITDAKVKVLKKER